MEKTKIIEILTEWNFWNKQINSGVYREIYTNKMLKYINLDKIISIVGVRRSGKSTLIRQLSQALIKNKVNKYNILIINFEEPAFERFDIKFLLKIYEAYLEILKPETSKKSKPYLFLDEIQNIKKWEKFVRSLNEKKEAFIVITGSSSKIMSQELASVLTGRQLYFEVFPLSFMEVLKFNNLHVKSKKEVLINHLTIKKIFHDYLSWGGFPEIVLNKDTELRRKILISYYEDIISRDIIQRFQIKKPDYLKTLAHYLLINISSDISFSRISKFIKLPVETIRRYSSYIEASYLIFFLKRFSFSLKEQENSPRKVYSIDTGLSNTIGFKFSHNYGKLIENIVALELKRRKAMDSPFLEFYYWKNHHGNKQVDFIIKEKEQVTNAIQVCWDMEDPRTKDREINSLLAGMKELNLQQGIIITEDFESIEKISNKQIICKPLWKWLLNNNL